MSKMSVGIDLGTTFSCVAVWRDQQVEIVPVDGHRTTPSSVTLDGQTVYDSKRMIGRRFVDLEDLEHKLHRRLVRPAFGIH